MELNRTTWILIPASLIALVSAGFALRSEALAMTPLERTLARMADDDAPRTTEQQALVNLAFDRFDAHGLELPEISIQFHDSLEVCGLHQGLYVLKTRSLHMCSLDKMTMFHEMAHAWANLNLSPEQQQAFAESRGLESWNDHQAAWEDRGTEHVAETIAWALMDEPAHVRWVETDGADHGEVSYRLLSIDVDIDSLANNFTWLTGQDPLYRSASERSAESGDEFSPEASR